MTDEDLPQHLRLDEFELFDEIRLIATSRFKDSDISGSEWRVGVLIEFWFKGSRVGSSSAMDMRTATMLLPSLYLQSDEIDLDVIRRIESRLCDQPGCRRPWSTTAVLRSLCDRRTGWLKTPRPGESTQVFFRRFCSAHADRGAGAGYEDCNENYVMRSVARGTKPE